MNWTAWRLLATTEFVLCFTPGQAVVYVIFSALQFSVHSGIASNRGIVSAGAVNSAFPATCAAALLTASYNLLFARQPRLAASTNRLAAGLPIGAGAGLAELGRS